MPLTVKKQKYAILLSVGTLKTVKDHIKGMGVQTKKSILLILVYVVAPSFFFPKWGHMSLNYRYVLFYEYLRVQAVLQLTLSISNS